MVGDDLSAATRESEDNDSLGQTPSRDMDQRSKWLGHKAKHQLITGETTLGGGGGGDVATLDVTSINGSACY